jgi:uncharacterized membrane protein
MMMTGMHTLWWVFPIIVLAVLAWLVWPPTRSLTDGSREAERVARRLYAAGEIDEIELRERLAMLRRQ